jgi:hypothetical protein
MDHNYNIKYLKLVLTGLHASAVSLLATAFSTAQQKQQKAATNTSFPHQRPDISSKRNESVFGRRMPS